MKNKKNIVIGVLCLTLIFMGIGFALFSASLNLSGTATSSGTFDVKITNVVLDTTKKTSGATDTTAAIPNNYAVTEQILSATFSEPGDYITWNITVTNRGNVDATILVNVSEDANGAYKLVCDVEEGTPIASSASISFPCEMSFDKNHELTAQEYTSLPKGTPVNMQVIVTAVQSSGVSPEEPGSGEIIVSGPWTITESTKRYSKKYGTVIKYDFNHQDASTNVVVPYSIDGLVVEKIDSTTFKDGDMIVYQETTNGNLACILNVTGDNANTIKTGLTNVFGSSVSYYDDVSEIPDGYENVGVFNYNPSTIMDPVTSSVQTIDFSQATDLREIGPFTLSASPLTSINFGNNSKLEKIGLGAFEVTEITGITLPASLKEIGAEAFSDCKLTGTITIPANVETIGNRAFSGKSNGTTNTISSINFESGSKLKTIGSSAFTYNALSGQLNLPASIESIGDYAFNGSTTTNRITSISFGNNSNLKTIGNYAFYNNALTSSLSIPASVERIGNYAFYGSTTTNRITSINFGTGSNLKTIGDYAFEYNQLSGGLVIPASVETIGNSAFEGSSTTNRISSLSFESNSKIKKIGNRAFYENIISNDLVLPDSLEEVVHAAFYGNQIGTLYLGSGIKTLGNAAFSSNPFSDVYVNMTQTEWNNNVTNNSSFENGTTFHFN